MADKEKLKELEELKKACMYSKDNYTDEDRKALCDGCEEECRFNKKEESINNGLDLGCGVIWKDEDPVSEPQVKESAKTQHVNKTCKENGNSLTQEPISDDLEAAIGTYLATYFGGEKEKQDWPFLKKMAIHFAKWQKEQLMAKAVDGVVHHHGNCKVASVYYNDPDNVPMAYYIPSEGVSEGDVVKIITIKED